MSNGDIQFEVDSLQRPIYAQRKPKLVQLVIDHSGGLVKNENQANYILLFASILVLGLSVYIFVHEKERPYQPSPQERQIIIMSQFVGQK